MLAKIALTLLVAFVALLLARRASRSQRRVRTAPQRRVTDLSPCPRCGVYRTVGGSCECEAPPMPRD